MGCDLVKMRDEILGELYSSGATPKAIDIAKLQIESEVLTNNLNEYEKVLDQQLANNHENKNYILECCNPVILADI